MCDLWFLIVHFNENPPHTPRDSSVLLQNKLDLLNKVMSSFTQSDQKRYDIYKYERDANEYIGNEKYGMATEIEADEAKPSEERSYQKINGLLSELNARNFRNSKLTKKLEYKLSNKSSCTAKFERLKKDYKFTIHARLKLQEKISVLQKKYNSLKKDRCLLHKAKTTKKIVFLLNQSHEFERKASSCKRNEKKRDPFEKLRKPFEKLRKPFEKLKKPFEKLKKPFEKLKRRFEKLLRFFGLNI